jgi:hypothetical protein
MGLTGQATEHERDDPQEAQGQSLLELDLAFGETRHRRVDIGGQMTVAET